MSWLTDLLILVDSFYEISKCYCHQEILQQCKYIARKKDTKIFVAENLSISDVESKSEFEKKKK